MVLLSTYYDYELKKTAYKLSGEKGYAKNTTTLLELVNIVDTNLDYCTATFKLNVTGDRGESQVVFYDNDLLIPVYYQNTEYRYLEWSNQTTSEVTISLRLSYENQHKIQAKYLANHRCIPSKSRIINIYRDLPLTAQTEIRLVFNNTDRIYDASTSPSVTATLSILDSSEHPTANQGQTITFVVDGSTHGTATTDEYGVIDSYSLSNLDVGLHIITARFTGNEYLFGTETSTELSKGYQVKILDSPKTVLNDDDIVVSASLSDYFDNPISSEPLTFAKTNSSHTPLDASATTDEDGKATITMASSVYTNYASLSSNVYTVPYCIRYSASEYSESATTYDGINMAIELTDGDYISSLNQTTELTGLVSPTRNNIFPVDVTVTTNGLTETVRTDKNGAFKYTYNGLGVGDTTVTASINDSSDSIDIVDTLQYWRANNKSYNKKYKWIVGEFRELTNGFKLSLGVDKSGTASLGIGDGSVFNDDFELSFKVIASYQVIQIGVEQWKKATPTGVSGHIDTLTSVVNGDVIKARKEDGVLTVYKNGTAISTYTGRKYYPAIWFDGGKNGYLLFDELKFKVI